MGRSGDRHQFLHGAVELEVCFVDLKVFPEVALRRLQLQGPVLPKNYVSSGHDSQLCLLFGCFIVIMDCRVSTVMCLHGTISKVGYVLFF